MAKALIIVPTYNERENVPGICERLFGALPAVDILFVDDNSPDGTGQMLDEIAANEPRVQVMHRAGKLGLGTAYVEGFRWALERTYEYVFEMDADGSHDPKYLPVMLELAEDGADVVIGSRNVPGGGTVNWGIGRKLISRGGSFYARSILDLDSLGSNGYMFQIETKYRAIQHGMKLVETPIIFEDRRVGQSKMSRAIVAEALTKVWALRFGR
jgi:dolichol-phosphate mannosyltransferase